MVRRTGSRTSAPLTAALAAMMAWSSLGASVVPARAATSPFTDIAGHTFEADIDWLWAEGITRGCAPERYCPDGPLARSHLAAFFVRAFDLPFSVIDAFADDDGSPYESQINSLAAAGITAGCTATTFCPTRAVTRGELATFLVRAMSLSVGAGRNYFRDDAGSTHEGDIDRLAAAGLTVGCNTWVYCPEREISRGEAAAMLHRIADPLPATLPFPAPTGVLTFHVGVGGSDPGNDCTTPSGPCRTVGRALQLTLDGDTIVIGPGRFLEEDLVVDVDLTIEGHPDGSVIDGGGGLRRRILTILTGTTVRIERLRITGGRFDTGAGIYTEGNLTLVASALVTNVASSAGGGLASRNAEVVVVDSEVTGNVAGSAGGGILTTEGSIRIERSTLTDNLANGSGGGMRSFFTAVTVIESTVIDNRAGLGGGLSISDGPTVIRDTTIAYNRATRGGGLHLSDLIDNTDLISGATINNNVATDHGGGAWFLTEVTVANSTLAGNSAQDAGAVACSSGDLRLVNTTITRNATASDGEHAAAIESPDVALPCAVRATNSIVAGNTGAPAQVADIMFEPVSSLVGLPPGVSLAEVLAIGFADNGGPTMTIALVNDPSNPARATANGTICAAAPVSGRDQRGMPRTGPCDMGAFEVQP